MQMRQTPENPIPFDQTLTPDCESLLARGEGRLRVAVRFELQGLGNVLLDGDRRRDETAETTASWWGAGGVVD